MKNKTKNDVLQRIDIKIREEQQNTVNKTYNDESGEEAIEKEKYEDPKNGEEEQ